MAEETPLAALAAAVLNAAAIKGVMIATAESCTGGLIAKLLTDRAGSSSVFDRGFITYSYASKHDMLGVEVRPEDGAVCERVAREMAEGARVRSTAQVTVAVTGIAGPGGGSDEKPVGLVHFATTGPQGTQVHQEVFSGDRKAVREATAARALRLLLDQLRANP